MKVYYSKMNVTPDKIVQLELALLHQTFGRENVLMHNGGKYDSNKLQSCDIIIVTGFNNRFKGKGVGSEILSALDLEIPAYMMAPRDDTGDIMDEEIYPEDTFRITEVEVFDSRDYMRQHYKLTLNEDGVTELDELIAKRYPKGNSVKSFDYRDEPIDNEEFFL